MDFPQSPKTGMIVLLRMYWAGIGIMVSLMGAGFLMMLGTTPAQKVQERALLERGWFGYKGLQENKGRVSPTTAMKQIPIFAKVLSKWSPIIQKGTSCAIPLVKPERMLVYYLTPMTSLAGIIIGRILSWGGQQLLVRNMTNRRGGGLSRVD